MLWMSYFSSAECLNTVCSIEMCWKEVDMQLAEIVTIEVGSAIATSILQLWLKDTVQRHYCPVLYTTILSFMNISSRKRLRVASRHPSPVFPWAKEAGACSRSFGEGNSFERRDGGSCTEGYSLLEELSVIPPLFGLSYNCLKQSTLP